jgi:hypothetical protein
LFNNIQLKKMSAWEAVAKERIRQRLSDLRERRDEMEEAKESEIRNSPEWCSAHSTVQNLQEEIDFLEELFSLTKNPSK